MNNQYNQNNFNNNNQVNNQQVNPAMQEFQQPIQNFNQQSKKKNIALVLGLSIVVIFILGIVAFFVAFSIEEKQDKPWKSGQVQILGKNIQLPCDVDTFESTLNTIILDKETSDVIKEVELQLSYKSTLKFDVYVENDLVTGVMIDAKESNTGKYDFLTEGENERSVAMNVVYPGNVTIETSIEKIKELYSTKPFNGSYRYSDEEVGTEPPYKLSARHHYGNGEWSINIHTLDGEVTSIDYYYVK